MRTAENQPPAHDSAFRNRLLFLLGITYAFLMIGGVVGFGFPAEVVWFLFLMIWIAQLVTLSGDLAVHANVNVPLALVQAVCIGIMFAWSAQQWFATIGFSTAHPGGNVLNQDLPAFTFTALWAVGGMFGLLAARTLGRYLYMLIFTAMALVGVLVAFVGLMLDFRQVVTMPYWTDFLAPLYLFMFTVWSIAPLYYLVTQRRAYLAYREALFKELDPDQLEDAGADGLVALPVNSSQN